MKKLFCQIFFQNRFSYVTKSTPTGESRPERSLTHAPYICLPRPCVPLRFPLPSFHSSARSSPGLRHGRHALPAVAVAVTSAVPAAPDPPLPMLPHRASPVTGGGGAEAGGGWWGRGRRRDILRAVQRHLRPPRRGPRRGAQDARLRWAPLPARHARGDLGTEVLLCCASRALGAAAAGPGRVIREAPRWGLCRAAAA